MDSSMLPSFTLGSEPVQFRYPACSHYRADRLREGIHCNDFASSSAHAPVATINCEMGTSAISSSGAKQIVGMGPKEQTRFYAKDAGQTVIQKDNHCNVFASSRLQKNGIVSDYVIHDVDTIQGALECAFSTLIPKYRIYPKITTCSRTDVGVHAFCNAAHIDLHNRYDAMYNPSFILHQVNRYLIKCHHDIKLLDCIPVTQDFHARRLAQSRSYVYRFMIPKKSDTTEKLQQMPIAEKSHTYCFRSKDFDIERVKRGTKLFVGKKNFQTFSAKSGASIEPIYVKTLDKFTVEKSSPLMPMDPLSEQFDFWHIECKARSFLYNQVRRMVTSLIALGAGITTEKDVKCMLQVPGHHNWNLALPVVPPVGLHLVNVEYSQEEINQFIINYKPVDFQESTTVLLNLEST